MRQRLALSAGRIYDAKGRQAEAEILVYGSESMGFPDRQSFYHILARMLPLRGQHSVAVPLSEFSKAQGKAEQRYGVIDANSQAMSNARIIDALYDPDPAFEKIRKAVIGDMSKNELKRALGAAGSISARNAEDLAPVFMFKSFPETYFHQQIAETLFQSNKLTDPERAQERVAETTRIITQALGLQIPGQPGGRNPLAYMLAIANSHDERTARGPYYNADTVEFTLLTFSYFGAKKAGIRKEDWFFLWKVFGSIMGLPPDRLHSNFEQAQSRMHVHRAACPSPPTQHSQVLLNTFIEAFLKDEDTIRDAVAQDLISKRMEDYLRIVNKWPGGMFRSTSLVRGFAGMPHGF